LYVWYKGMVAKQLSLLLHRPSAMLPVLFQISGELLVYLGLFALPVLVCFAPAVWRCFGKQNSVGALAPSTAAALIVFSLSKFIFGENRWMPFSQNLLRLPELGAHTILGINQVALSQKWRSNLTYLSGAAGFILSIFLLDTFARTVKNLWRVFRSEAYPSVEIQAGRRFGNALAALAAVLIFGFQFAFNTLQSTFSDIDRYYLFPFLGASLCLALAWRWHKVRFAKLLALPVLALLFFYSVAATQDMMAWNRARWDGIEILEKQGVKFQEIDGGAEYNYARDPQLFKNLILHDTWYEFTHRGEAPRDQWRWWTVAGEQYIISFSPVPNYEQLAKVPYWSALSGKREILVLKRSGQ